jgi:hypothetical protein
MQSKQEMLRRLLFPLFLLSDLGFMGFLVDAEEIGNALGA